MAQSQASAAGPVAVLFARADSVYKSVAGADVWDIERDARLWGGGCPVVAHPPCRAWGQLRHMAKPRADEKELALWAVEKVRAFGGVLEHPSGSQLWPVAGLPDCGRVDEFGGWTLPISQFWFGHRAEKKTFLYIVGCDYRNIPDIPMALGDAPCVVANGAANKHRKPGDQAYRGQITKAEREHTPEPLARWLCDLARRCGGRG